MDGDSIWAEFCDKTSLENHLTLGQEYVRIVISAASFGQRASLMIDLGTAVDERTWAQRSFHSMRFDSCWCPTLRKPKFGECEFSLDEVKPACYLQLVVKWYETRPLLLNNTLKLLMLIGQSSDVFGLLFELLALTFGFRLKMFFVLQKKCNSCYNCMFHSLSNSFLWFNETSDPIKT